MHLHSTHINYLIFAVVGLFMIFFLLKKWVFIAAALSESGQPSSRRITAFMFAFCVAFCETYTTLKTQKLEFSHLIALLATIVLSLGLATFPEIIKLWRGNTENK